MKENCTSGLSLSKDRTSRNQLQNPQQGTTRDSGYLQTLAPVLQRRYLPGGGLLRSPKFGVLYHNKSTQSKTCQVGLELAGIEFPIYYWLEVKNSKPDALFGCLEYCAEKGWSENQAITTVLSKDHFDTWKRSGISLVCLSARLTSLPARSGSRKQWCKESSNLSTTPMWQVTWVKTKPLNSLVKFLVAKDERTNNRLCLELPGVSAK